MVYILNMLYMFILAYFKKLSFKCIVFIIIKLGHVLNDFNL